VKTLNKMADEQNNSIQLLDRLIDERREHFLHALPECAQQNLLMRLKKEIDFLVEKRNQLLKSIKNTATAFNYQ
jgi:hypothetical protein